MTTLSRYAITGAGGLLGQSLTGIACDAHTTLALHRKLSPGNDAHGHAKTDLLDFSNTCRLLDRFQPDAIIHCAAISNPGVCEKDPDQSYQINVAATEHLARYAAEKGIAFTFTSTDLVFDGHHAPYVESDLPSPLSNYARHKVEAEQRVLAIHPEALVCRLPLLLGVRNGELSGYAAFILEQARKGADCPLFIDEFRSALGTNCAAKGLLRFTGHQRGILHLGGPHRVSRYEAGLLVADALSINKTLLRPVSQQDVKTSIPRPPDVTLDSSKAFELGFQPLPLKQALESILCTLREG